MSDVVSAVVEGPVDAAVVTAVVRSCGLEIGTIYGQQGKGLIRKRIAGYNAASKFSPWVVVVDLDDEGCAPDLMDAWLPNRHSNLCFRVAVREVEAWLLADREGFALFLGVSSSRLPDDPDKIVNPKEFVVSLARQSRKRAIRDQMVPREGSGRTVGVAYASRLIEFVTDGRWRPHVARKVSQSLNGALRCVERLR